MICSRRATVAVVLILAAAGELVAVAGSATGGSSQAADERTSLGAAPIEQAQTSDTETIDLTRQPGLVPDVPAT